MAFDWQRFMMLEAAGNSMKEYAIALGMFIGLIIILKIFKYQIIHHLKILSKKTKTEIDDIIIKAVDSIGWMFYALLSIYIPLKFLALPAIADKIIDYGIIIVIVFYAVKIFNKGLDFGKEMYVKKKGEEDTTAIRLLIKIFKVIIWIIAGLLIISNLGYNVSSLVAGLGIGGIAIGLALQNVFSDIFASFSIYFDKPFKVGDYIVIGTDRGIVKKIGIKSTRMQTLQGEELIVSNRELTETRINNYKKLKKRRINFTLGVVYGTPTLKLEKIPKIITEIMKKAKKAELDRVHFKQFGDFSLNFEIVYYVDSSEYAEYMDIQQEINLEIKKAFEKEKIEMAFPTQTVYVNK